MRLARPGNYNFVRSQFLFLTRDMECALAAENKVDLIGFRVAVNPLILPRFKAIQIAEVLRRIKQRNLLHLVIGKTDELGGITSVH